MKKLIIAIFMMCGACSNEKVKMPELVDQTTDFSSAVASEKDLNNNGCTFGEKDHAMGLNCIEPSTPLAKYRQKISIVKYMNANQDALDNIKAGVGKVVNPGTVRTLAKKALASFINISFSAKFADLESEKYKTSAPDTYVELQAMEFLLYAANLANCPTDITSQGLVIHDARKKAQNDDALRDRAKDLLENVAPYLDGTSPDEHSLAKQVIQAFPQYFEVEP